MNDALQHMLSGSRSRHLLLDSNLLLLWITAKYDPSLLRSFKRVQMFYQSDAVLLAWVIDQFSGLLTTPHILTEASNLANSLSSFSRVEWLRLLGDFALDTVERFTDSNTLSRSPEFARFGIADAALFDLSESCQIITVDRRLSGYIVSLNKPCLNFIDIRNTAS